VDGLKIFWSRGRLPRFECGGECKPRLPDPRRTNNVLCTKRSFSDSRCSGWHFAERQQAVAWSPAVENRSFFAGQKNASDPQTRRIFRRNASKLPGCQFRVGGQRTVSPAPSRATLPAVSLSGGHVRAGAGARVKMTSPPRPDRASRPAKRAGDWLVSENGHRAINRQRLDAGRPNLDARNSPTMDTMTRSSPPMTTHSIGLRRSVHEN